MDIKISLATLSQLEDGRSYYLSNTTGTIKRTGLWQWFKCVTGLGDGREKAQRLAQVVKESLLATAGISKDAALTEDINRFEGATYSIYGSTLRDIAGRFKTAHADAIEVNDVRRSANQIAEQVAEEKVQRWYDGSFVGINPERPNVCRDYIKKLALYSVQHLVRQAAEDRKVPADLSDSMRRSMQKMINNVSTAETMQAMRSGQGYPMVRAKNERSFKRFDFDELHFRAILAALLTEDGPVSSYVFTRRLAILQEDILQERKDALMQTPLDPPSNPESGYIFAESAMKAFKVAEDSEWNRQA